VVKPAGREENRRRVLTRDRVVAEVLAIISASGTAALSMRTLATCLGVVPAALYRHVRSKEQPYDLVLDGVLAEVDPALPWTGQVTALALGLPDDLRLHHRLRALIEVTGNPGQAPAVLDDHLATLSGSPTPTSSTPGTPVGGMAMPAAAALPDQWPRPGSRQIAGRACVQIDRICPHNECARHDSAAVPNGGSGAWIRGWPAVKSDGAPGGSGRECLTARETARR
jgi:AcrR family transcriptional regulator